MCVLGGVGEGVRGGGGVAEERKDVGGGEVGGGVSQCSDHRSLSIVLATVKQSKTKYMSPNAAMIILCLSLVLRVVQRSRRLPVQLSASVLCPLCPAHYSKVHVSQWSCYRLLSVRCVWHTIARYTPPCGAVIVSCLSVVSGTL